MKIALAFLVSLASAGPMLRDGYPEGKENTGSHTPVKSTTQPSPTTSQTSYISEEDKILDQALDEIGSAFAQLMKESSPTSGTLSTSESKTLPTSESRTQSTALPSPSIVPNGVKDLGNAIEKGDIKKGDEDQISKMVFGNSFASASASQQKLVKEISKSITETKSFSQIIKQVRKDLGLPEEQTKKDNGTKGQTKTSASSKVSAEANASANASVNAGVVSAKAEASAAANV